MSRLTRVAIETLAVSCTLGLLFVVAAFGIVEILLITTIGTWSLLPNAVIFGAQLFLLAKMRDAWEIRRMMLGRR